MGELRNPTSFGLPAAGFCTSPTFGSGEPTDSLERTLRRVRELPSGNSPPLVRAARPLLTASTQIRIATQIATISNHVSHEFHSGVDRLQSRSREQRIAFARQLGMFLCRKITRASFESIGAHFRRDHSTVIHAYRAIEQRTQRDAAFRLFIRKLEERILGTVQVSPRL
jgi:chromosomal replication initiator protein